jgi:hypothetical protein
MRDISMQRHNRRLGLTIAIAVIGFTLCGADPADAGPFQRCHRLAFKRAGAYQRTASIAADQSQDHVGRATPESGASALEQASSGASGMVTMEDETSFADEALDWSFEAEDDGTSWDVNDDGAGEEPGWDESESYGDKGTYDSDDANEESAGWNEGLDAEDQRAEEAFESGDEMDPGESEQFEEPLEASGATRRLGLSEDDLLAPDRAVLRELDAMGEEELVARETVLESYLGSLGSEARDYFTRWEAATSSDVRDLADNLSRIAALLATFRSYQRGNVTTDEALDLARGSMGCLPQSWIDAVTRISSERVYGADSGTAASGSQNREWSPRRTVEQGLLRVTVVWGSRLLDRWKIALNRAPFWQTVRDQWANWLGQPVPADGAAALRVDVSGFGVHR